MRLAVDCDLRKLYATDETGQVICKAAPDATAIERWAYEHQSGTILFEVASALDYTDSKAVAHQKRRWTIFNIATAARLDAYCTRLGGPQVLVAPSHVWTHGHPLATRHRIAQCQHSQKDLRETEAMLWFHRQAPRDWMPLSAWLTQL